MLSKIDNHGVNMVDGRLEFFVTQFTLSETERSTFVRSRWAIFITDRSMANLSIRALRIAKISTLLLAFWALPFGAMTHV